MLELNIYSDGIFRDLGAFQSATMFLDIMTLETCIILLAINRIYIELSEQHIHDSRSSMYHSTYERISIISQLERLMGTIHSMLIYKNSPPSMLFAQYSQR